MEPPLLNEQPRKPVPYSGPDLSDRKPTFDSRLLFVAWAITVLLSIEFVVPNSPALFYKVAVAAMTSNTAAAEDGASETARCEFPECR